MNIEQMPKYLTTLAKKAEKVSATKTLRVVAVIKHFTNVDLYCLQSLAINSAKLKTVSQFTWYIHLVTGIASFKEKHTIYTRCSIGTDPESYKIISH